MNASSPARARGPLDDRRTAQQQPRGTERLARPGVEAERVVVFGGEAGTVMTIAREKTNWAAHRYVYMAVLALGVGMVYLALTGTEESDPAKPEDGEDVEAQRV